ncbi:hypothetical protein LOTGIDRAFT_238272 [Lottia gigantea]|uniref:Ig-like domain-containing protein n=1 Tax=Lottia gigantea TaxID=225164 RepID=V4CHE6_LOTGI|nr:hypothetical protein LOTGIDRAFT_238272 [Lottia gigantea]ESP01540.1 hypothetical protein LOTGIDRAFT_238272 [Lottia gigantea]
MKSFIGLFLALAALIDLANSMSTGEYICRAGEAEGSVEVTVVKDVNHVELRIGDNPPVIGEEINPYEAEFIKHKTNIECTAFGSFPAAHIELYLGTDKIEPESNLNTKLIGTEYKSAIVARKTLYPKHSGKKLRCVASVHLPPETPLQPVEKESSIPLHIITLVPLITCKNKTASMKDKYVNLECDVSAEKPMRSLFWKLGYNNQYIYPGNKTADFDEVTVEEIEGNDKNKRVTLSIYKMKKEHFNSIFYLIVEDNSGEIYQEPVYISQYYSSGLILRPCLLTLLILVFTQLFH